MVLETQFPKLGDWILPALTNWIILLTVFCLVAIVVGFLLTGVRMGPKRAGGIVWGAIKSAFFDLFNVSAGRIFAIAQLSFKEAIRRKIVVGFIVFIVILLFAGMFLDPQSQHPARLYVNFIFWVNTTLILVLALFTSTFSIPNDFKYKTIYTISTKPVRPGEIVLGRILGFLAMGTVMLAVMGLVSYAFVQRSLAHSHVITADDLNQLPGAEEGKPAMEGQTSRVREHRHRVFIPSEMWADGKEHTLFVDSASGHTHELTITGSGANRQYRLSGIREMFTARVPVYGELRFRDNNGMDAKEGICVGDEWTYRSFIQGRSDAASIWTFTNVTETRFPQGLPVEMTLGVFRTHKGNIERGVLGGLALRNPDTGLMVETHLFESVEFDTKKLLVPQKIKPASRPMMVPRKWKNRQGALVLDPPENQLNESLAQKSEYSLFEDLVTKDGRVEIWLTCLDPMQYFGAAAADMYLRASDASFAVNFFKGFVCIWLEMTLVIVFGVVFSTLLSTPIAIVGTLFIMVAGLFHQYICAFAKGGMIGGGALESTWRLMRQDNMVSELPDNVTTNTIEMADKLSQGPIWVISKLTPDVQKFANAEYVASGFDIPWSLLTIDLFIVIAFVVPLYIAGYLCMKLREIAA